MYKYKFSIGTQETDINYIDSKDISGTIQNVEIGAYQVYAIDSRNKLKFSIYIKII